MRIIDADKLKKTIADPLNSAYGVDCTKYTRKLIDYAPTVDQWHYPSRGELPEKDWTKHPLNVSKKCFVVTKMGIGTIARWDNDCIMWFERPQLPVLEVIAWQYFVPPKEEA